MVLFPPFRNGINREDHWTLTGSLDFFNTVLFLMDYIHSFSGTSYHCSHACLSVIVIITTKFYFSFYVKRHYNSFLWGFFLLFLWGMHACRYLSMQLCLWCQHLRIHSKDFLMMIHSSYTKNI